MLGNAIGWIFHLIGRLWEGFWNVCGKLFGLAIFTIACGAAAAAFLKLSDAASKDAWLYFKGGAFIGFTLGGIRLLINEVAVPMVYEQERRARQQARKEFDLRLAKEQALARRESVSNRLKHLN